MAAGYEEAVAAWTHHLRSGGTTTWAAWRASSQRPGHPSGGPVAAPADERGGRAPLPDAVHLELVRRLNLAAGHPDEALADRVLGTAAPGRGLIDVPLPWPGERRPFGTPSIDPGQLPPEELLRLAAGLLVHLLPSCPRPTGAEERQPWPVPWRRRFQLHGSPGTAAAIARGLRDQGLVETSWRPTHVVVARPVEVMMAERWSARTRAGGSLRWSTVWRRAEAAGRLPPGLDAAAVVGRLTGHPTGHQAAHQPGRHSRRRHEPVHVVVARDAQEAADTTARLLRARPFTLDGGGDLSQTDLLRRVNRLVAVTHGPDRVRDLAARLAAVLDTLPTLPGAATAVPPPLVPRAQRSWATTRAAALAEDLRRGDYAVHGDPDGLVPAAHERSGPVGRRRTLDIAVAACLRTWALQGGTP